LQRCRVYNQKSLGAIQWEQGPHLIPAAQTCRTLPSPRPLRGPLMRLLDRGTGCGACGSRIPTNIVMAGLVPAIHVFFAARLMRGYPVILPALSLALLERSVPGMTESLVEAVVEIVPLGIHGEDQPHLPCAWPTPSP